MNANRSDFEALLNHIAGDLKPKFYQTDLVHLGPFKLIAHLVLREVKYASPNGLSEHVYPSKRPCCLVSSPEDFACLDYLALVLFAPPLQNTLDHL